MISYALYVIDDEETIRESLSMALEGDYTIKTFDEGKGADAAGRARKPYPANLRVIRVLCSGRTDPQFVMEAFKEGADGVLILGCHPGDCHYKEGNFQVLKRYAILRRVLPQFGIEEEMVIYFINENAFFTNVMKDFPKANIVIEDKDNNRKLKLRVKIDAAGKITLLEDGQYNDANVTLKVPLRDALNIFGNAQNINAVTLIGFAVNVRTEPEGIKNEVIRKVLRGEYN